MALSGCSTTDRVVSAPDTTEALGTPTASTLALDQQAVRDGDRLRATGRVVSVPGKPVRFCSTGYRSAAFLDPPAPQYCETGVDVQGVDIAQLVSSRTKDGATEGHATIEGRWRAGVLHVDQQRPTDYTAADAGPDTVPCPRPADGWPATGSNDNLAEPAQIAMYDYIDSHPGSQDRLKLLRPAAGKAVLAIGVEGAAERDEVERSLRPVVGDALCVVTTHTDVEALAAARADKSLTLGPDIWLSGFGLTDALERQLHLGVTMVTPQLRGAADRYPAGLVDFEPNIRKIG